MDARRNSGQKQQHGWWQRQVWREKQGFRLGRSLAGSSHQVRSNAKTRKKERESETSQLGFCDLGTGTEDRIGISSVKDFNKTRYTTLFVYILYTLNTRVNYNVVYVVRWNVKFSLVFLKLYFWDLRIWKNYELVHAIRTTFHLLFIVIKMTDDLTDNLKFRKK